MISNSRCCLHKKKQWLGLLIIFNLKMVFKINTICTNMQILLIRECSSDAVAVYAYLTFGWRENNLRPDSIKTSFAHCWPLFFTQEQYYFHGVWFMKKCGIDPCSRPEYRFFLLSCFCFSRCHTNKDNTLIEIFIQKLLINLITNSFTSWWPAQLTMIASHFIKVP